MVLVVGLVLTVVLVVSSRTGFESNEQRLLEERTRQAAAVLVAALPSIQTPLASAAEVAEEDSGSQPPFRRLMTPIVERGEPYVSASLWPVDDSVAPLTVVGVEPKLASEPADVVHSFLERASISNGLTVIGLLDGESPRLGYGYSTSRGPGRFVAYAEGALPPERTSVVPADSAFAGLDNAVYLGVQEDSAMLLTASTPELPLTGRRASESVEFGDTDLLLVMSPTENLGGQLLATLPWLVGGVGLVSTAGTAFLVERLLRRRVYADKLAAENRVLYTNQLSVARTLQHSLLPQELPVVNGIEFGARYVAGVADLDIGGDWYDVVELDDSRVLVVVGDVSGRGLEAGTVMASLRYAVRAFASRGDEPATILMGLNRLLDVERDGHFATVLCAVISVDDRRVTIVNAGHPSPLMIDAGSVQFLGTETGPPIGVTAGAQYAAVTHVLPEGATLLMFTDGLYERRGESIDVGLERLRSSVAGDDDLIGLLDTLIANQTNHFTHDDSAILGARWTTTTNMSTN